MSKWFDLSSEINPQSIGSAVGSTSSNIGFDLSNVNWDWVKGAGSLLGGAGAIYNAYNTNKQYKIANNLYAEERQRQIDKENKAQKSLDDAVALSFGKKEDIQNG